MKRMSLNCLAGMMLMLPMASMAQEPNEHEESEELCEIALRISAEKGERNVHGVSCEINAQSAEFWRCVIERQGVNEPLMFATANCDEQIR